MRLLIVSTKQRIANYNEFIKALNSFRVEAICVHDVKYCFLSEFRPLHIVPFPKALNLIRRFNPDLVMTDDPHHISRMVKLTHRPMFLHLRGGMWGEDSWDKAMYPSLFVRMYSHYLEAIRASNIKKADLILPNSKWLKKRVKQHLPNHPTKVLYAGINSGNWVPNHNQTFNLKHPAVVAVFPFSIYAKVSGLLKFAKVVKKMPDVNFYFAGNGPYFNLVKQNCPSNMLLMGKISRLEVKKLLQTGDVFVHPAGSDALPRSVKEASLMEKPIIASNVGGIPEIIKNGQTGYLCNINENDQWIEKIRFLLDNPDVARKFGKNAREYVMKTFDWRKIAEGFLKIFKDFTG